MTGEREVSYGVVGINPRVRRSILNGIARSRNARLAGVCSRDAEKAVQTAAEFGGKAYTVLADLLADPDVDVVFICTPHALHSSMALAALRAGKMVICEKPLAISLDEAEELAVAARESGLPNLVNFTYHSLPGPRFVERLLREGTIGRLLHLDFSYWQARQRLPGMKPSDALLDVGSHQVDLAQWWCTAGEAGNIVDTAGQQFSTPELGTPVFSALARTERGSMVTIQGDRIAAGWKNGMVSRLVGEQGTITLTFDTDQTTVEIARLGEESPEGTSRELPIPADLAISYADFPARHIERLTAALLGEVEFPDFSYGRRCQAILDAIRSSAQDHCWVNIR